MTIIRRTILTAAGLGLAATLGTACSSSDDQAAGKQAGTVDLTTATTMPLDQLVDIAIADTNMGELCSSYREAVAAAGPEAAYNVALESFVNGGGDSTRQFGYEPSAVLDEVLSRCQDDTGNPDDVAVVEGMTPAQVEKILGEPTATVELVDPETGVPNGYKATYDGMGGSWVSYTNDHVESYIIGGYTGTP